MLRHDVSRVNGGGAGGRNVFPKERRRRKERKKNREKRRNIYIYIRGEAERKIATFISRGIYVRIRGVYTCMYGLTCIDASPSPPGRRRF